jgi:uncharacterized membrane protein YgcG
MRYLAALLFLLAGLVVPAGAAEQILSFDVAVEVRPDSVLDVTETITVNAEGREIRRGIYRDIPLKALDEWGLWSRNGFIIEEIRHNGKPAPYRTEWIGRFLRIYIGDADVLIPSGEHVYTIAYSTTHQLRFFDRYDELYWNVTGNFWSFPILRASVRISLPRGAQAEQMEAYTGSFGSTGRDYRASGQGSSTPFFETTRPLAAGEGLTVAVGFTKGAVETGGPGAIASLAANSGALLFSFGWLFVLFYFLVIWWRVGRDPLMETVIPLFHPPENLSPAAMSYVHFNGFRSIGRGADLAFVAALLSLGVKKYLTIEQSDRDKITFIKGDGGGQPLHAGESALYSHLFSGRDEVPVDKRYGKMLLTARSKLHGAITREYSGKFFRRNLGWFLPGAAVAAIATVLGLFLQAPPDSALDALVPVLAFSLGGWICLMMGWHRFTNPVATFARKFFGLLMVAAGGVLLLVALTAAMFATDLPAYRFGSLMLFSGVALVVAMYFLLAAPTLAGAKVLSRIEGFKLYLRTAESNRLNMRDAPQMSEELYERFLPYAAGLGVEEPWSRAYSAHLARIGPDEETEYAPAWYRGRRWTSGSLAEATSASMAAISAAMAASMPQPKSSSGSSGGGFSGGGGGGGGGGGW